MPPQQQQQQQGDNSLAALWLAILFFGLFALIWYVFHSQIVWFFLKVKYAEMAVVSLFLSGTVPLTQAIGQLKASHLPMANLMHIMTLVGSYIRYPLCLILLMLATILFCFQPTLRFKKAYSMKTLLEQEKVNWPQVMPVSGLNLVKQSIDTGVWSMGLSPMQFAKKYRLLYEERDMSGKIIIGEMRNRIKVGVLRAEAYQVFSLQLGSYWRNVESLPAHIKALFAIFSCRINRDQVSAKMLLDNASLSFSSGKMDFSSVDSILTKYKNTLLVKQVIDRHAFILTVMASMLEAARQDGVLATADFLWLKAVDRPLWFMLNSVGRQTPLSEVSGPFGHWLAEKKLGNRINAPMVDEAVKALELGIKDIIYVPDKPKPGK